MKLRCVCLIEVNVQIAHLAGTGDYADPPVDAVLSVFVDSIARNDPPR